MCRQGDIYVANMRAEGSLHLMKQPVLVISSDMANKMSSVVSVLPITDNEEQDKLLTCISIGNYGLSGKNVIIIERISTLEQNQLLAKIGSIRGITYESQIKQAVKMHLGL